MGSFESRYFINYYLATLLDTCFMKYLRGFPIHQWTSYSSHYTQFNYWTDWLVVRTIVELLRSVCRWEAVLKINQKKAIFKHKQIFTRTTKTHGMKMNIIIVVFTAKTWKKRTKSSLQKVQQEKKNMCAR